MHPIENCPSCGSKMEKGFISKTGTSRLVWTKRKHHFFFITDAETIAPMFWGNNLEAYRCKECKLVLFYYGEKE